MAQLSSKIAPFLWYDHQAEEACTLYCSLFSNSSILNKMPGPGGKLMGITFQLEGLRLTAFNGGPTYALTPALSLYVSCDDQAEIDRLWEALTQGGKVLQCGWVTDRFGLCWQILPEMFGRLMQAGEPVKAQRMFQALMGMQKVIIKDLQAAYHQA